MKSIIDFIEKNLSDKRRRHTYGVCDEAVRLAGKYGEDEGNAAMAALFHDMYKCISQEELERLVDLYGLEPRYKESLNLAHGKLAAEAMKRDFGITDEDLISAVSFHTTGRANMSLLEKIIYIADATEPNRDFPGVDELRSLVDEDIDRACLLSMIRTREHLEAAGGFIDEDTLSAVNYFKEGDNRW